MYVLLLAQLPQGLLNFSFSLPEVQTGEFEIEAKTNTIDMLFRYGLEAFADGPVIRPRVFISRQPYPLPSATWLAAWLLNNKAPMFPPIPDSEQSFVFPMFMKVRQYDRLLQYDPEISLTLLFDPEPLPPTSEISSAGISAGVIAAIVVVPLVMAAGVTVFALVVFPYLKQRRAAANQPLPDLDATEGEGERGSGASWKAARATTKE